MEVQKNLNYRFADDVRWMMGHNSFIIFLYFACYLMQPTLSSFVLLQEDRENILRARASGKGVLTSPFKLLKSNHLGVVLTFAVYSTNLPLNAMPEERINATVG